MKNLKYILMVGLVTTLFLSSCNKDCHKPDKPKPKPTNSTNAIITGYDYRKCSCCGGMMITFSEDPVPYSATFVKVSELPANTGIGENSEFPIYVKVQYTKVSDDCGGAVKITALERR